jgi:hypothetical protein
MEIAVDYHPRFQRIAFLMEKTGEYTGMVSHLDYLRRYAVTQELLDPFSFDRADSGFCLPPAEPTVALSSSSTIRTRVSFLSLSSFSGTESSA